MGRNLHPNNLLLLSKRQRVTEWDALCSEPMEDPVQELTSGNVTGCPGMSQPDIQTSSKGLLSGPDSDGFSTDVSDRARGRGRGWPRWSFATVSAMVPHAPRGTAARGQQGKDMGWGQEGGGLTSSPLLSKRG